MSKKKGFEAEEQAKAYLLKQGLTWVKSNYQCRLGEIDLIMREGNFLIFVEVRARTSVLFGGAIESITYTKRQKILKTALHYLVVNGLENKMMSRFDVIALEGEPFKMTWIKDAFRQDF